MLIPLLLPTLALAQGFDAHGLHLAADDGDLQDLLATWSPEAADPGRVGFASTFEFDNVVLAEQKPTGTGYQRVVILDDLFGADLSASIGLHRRLSLAAQMPVWVTYVENGATGPSTIGDLRLSAPIGILVPGEGGGVGLSVVPQLSVPTGDEDHLLGEPGFTGGGVVAASAGSERGRVVANAGLEAAPTVDVENVGGGARALLSAGGSYAVSEKVALRGEVSASPTLRRSDGTVTYDELPAEALVSLRFAPRPGFALTLGGAQALTGSVGAAAERVFLGAAWHPVPKRDLDTDADGLANDADQCPDQAEVVNGYADGDGCPDQLAQVAVKVTDTDGDAVGSADVAMAGQHATTGADGRASFADVVPSAVTLTATPPGDGEPARLETVLKEGPNEFVLRVPAAKAPEPPQTVAKARPTLPTLSGERIEFPLNEFTLGPAARRNLDGIAATLLAHPDGWRLEIHGHADASGPETLNTELSERRAEAVRDYLVAAGVPQSQLDVRWHGESQPLVPNDTPAHMAQNRRVELVLVEVTP